MVVLLLGVAWESYLVWSDEGYCQKKAQHINCVNNMKQLGLAFRIWSGDNRDLYPFNVSTNAGGTLELCNRDSDGFDRNGFLSLQAMSNELSTTKILLCPKDKTKHLATNFFNLRPENVSYRIRSGRNIDETNPLEILAVCPVDGNILYCDGSVSPKGTKRIGRASQTPVPPVLFNRMVATNPAERAVLKPEIALPNTPTTRVGLDGKLDGDTNSAR